MNRRDWLLALFVLGMDFLAFRLFLNLGFDLAAAHITSFILVMTFGYLLSAQSWFAATAERKHSIGRQYPKLVVVCLLALSLRGGVLSLAIDTWQLPAETAILFAIAAGAIVTYVGCALYVIPSEILASSSEHWRTVAIGIVIYVLALRLAFLGSVDLLPEEAYYWNYAQHLDIGYLDHPPMVAWLIWAGTNLLHDTEFAVRLGANLCWIVAAAFCFLLARNLYGKTAALIAVLLFACLPYFFAIGFLMTPEAPLTMAWAGALYYLERALLGGKRTAWLYAGIWVGLGLLSKYTIALLGPAVILFAVLDPQSRFWFRRRSPYFSILVAAVLFAPVIVWNAQHDWASFMFQGPQRLQSSPRFSLFHLLGSILVLLTPVGLAAVVIAFIRQVKTHFRDLGSPIDRRSLFVVTFTLAPLSVFVLFSLQHQVKLDWTGPLWLAMLPMLAAEIAAVPGVIGPWSEPLRRIWGPTIAAVLLVYGAALHYMALGLPAIGYSDDPTTLPVAWKEFGRQAALIEQDIDAVTGDEPLRVGIDKNFLSSEMAFYDPVDKDGAANTAGRRLFGRDSLMYDYWFPAPQQRGRTVILFALKSNDLLDPVFETHFERLGPVREQVIYKGSARAGRFYYRVGYNYGTG